MEDDDSNSHQGEGDATCFRILFKSRGAGGASLSIGDLGGHSLHGKIPGGVSVPGGEMDDRVVPVEETGQ